MELGSQFLWSQKRKMAHQLLRASILSRNTSYIPLVLLVLVTTLILRQYNPFYDSFHTDVYEHLPTKGSTSTPPTTPSGLLIPPKIWQILLPQARHADGPFTIDPSQLVDTPSWIAKNPDYNYKLVTSEWADAFVDAHFAASDPALAQTYHALRNPGLKSDLLRYLLLSVEGGVYTDVDTVALRPVDEWVAPALRGTVRLVVGVEFDQRDGGMWDEIPHALQFCQWTIAAAPGHPIFAAMAARAAASLRALAAAAAAAAAATAAEDVHDVVGGGVLQDLARLRPTSFEVMNATGPAAWTDVLFEQLRRAEPGLTDLRNLSGMTGPRLYGDILVLNIDGFGVGQVHSGSTNDGTYPDTAFVKHNFRGSWREHDG